ncbi:MAG: periplasmic heavy metal sensor [Puniceicoccales bacterium]
MSANNDRKNRIRVSIALVIALIVLCVMVSAITLQLMPRESDWSRHDESGGHQWLHQELDLTPEEAARVDELEPEYRLQRTELQDEFQAKIAELRQEIVVSDEFSPQVAELIHELHIIHGQLQELSIRHYFQMMQVLPVEKQALLRDIAARALSVPQ